MQYELESWTDSFFKKKVCFFVFNECHVGLKIFKKDGFFPSDQCIKHRT